MNIELDSSLFYFRIVHCVRNQNNSRKEVGPTFLNVLRNVLPSSFFYLLIKVLKFKSSFSSHFKNFLFKHIFEPNDCFLYQNDFAGNLKTTKKILIKSRNNQICSYHISSKIEITWPIQITDQNQNELVTGHQSKMHSLLRNYENETKKKKKSLTLFVNHNLNLKSIHKEDLFEISQGFHKRQPNTI